jgi:hypothetical protein
MTDDEIDEIVRVVDGYLSGRPSAAAWRLWFRSRQEAERAGVLPPDKWGMIRAGSTNVMR